MTEMTTKQIGEQLQRSDLTATVYQDLVRAIAARRRIASERLGSIEDDGAMRRAAIESGDSEALVALNREAEALDDELGFLGAFEARAYKLHAAAADRETIEAGQRGHRRIAQLIGNAETALAAYVTARQRLDEATSAIGGANELLFAERIAAFGHTNVDQRERLIVDDATLDRIVDAMAPPLLVREEQRLGARSGLRRNICAPVPEQYGEPSDLREQTHANMFQRRDS